MFDTLMSIYVEPQEIFQKIGKKRWKFLLTPVAANKT